MTQPMTMADHLELMSRVHFQKLASTSARTAGAIEMGQVLAHQAAQEDDGLEKEALLGIGVALRGGLTAAKEALSATKGVKGVGTVQRAVGALRRGVSAARASHAGFRQQFNLVRPNKGILGGLREAEHRVSSFAPGNYKPSVGTGGAVSGKVAPSPSAASTQRLPTVNTQASRSAPLPKLDPGASGGYTQAVNEARGYVSPTGTSLGVPVRTPGAVQGPALSAGTNLGTADTMAATPGALARPRTPARGGAVVPVRGVTPPRPTGGGAIVPAQGSAMTPRSGAGALASRTAPSEFVATPSMVMPAGSIPEGVPHTLSPRSVRVPQLPAEQSKGQTAWNKLSPERQQELRRRVREMTPEQRAELDAGRVPKKKLTADEQLAQAKARDAQNAAFMEMHDIDPADAAQAAFGKRGKKGGIPWIRASMLTGASALPIAALTVPTAAAQYLGTSRVPYQYGMGSFMPGRFAQQM